MGKGHVVLNSIFLISDEKGYSITIADFEGDKIKKLLEFRSDPNHFNPYSF